jgi:hypothetical protein
MTARERNNKDLAILSSITGRDDAKSCGMQIEDDYLLREKMENLKEQGFGVPEEFLPELRTKEEIRQFTNNKRLEELEFQRCPLYPDNWYPGSDNKEDSTMALKDGTMIQYYDKATKKQVVGHVDITENIRITYSKIILWDKNTRGNKLKDIIVERVYQVNPKTKEVIKPLAKILHGATWIKSNLWSMIVPKESESVVTEQVYKC